MELVFTNLAEKTTLKEKKLLSKTIYFALTNIDKNYLNFIGELAILNLLKNADFELLQTEFPLSDNHESKSIDFLVFKEGKSSLLEVVNIHLPESKLLTDNYIERLLDQKIIGKILNKSNDSNIKFSLAPVI